MSTRRGWLLALALVAVDGKVVEAQRSAPSTWLVEPPSFVDATAVEQARILATIDEIERILRQVPELDRPRGFEIVKKVAAGHHVWAPDGPFHMVIGLQFFAPSVKIAGEGRTCLLVSVNLPTGRPTEIRGLEDENGIEFRHEWPVGEPKPGSTIVYEGLRWLTPEQFDDRPGFVTFSTGGVFPWLAVTREEYLRAEILSVEGKKGDQETSYRKALEKTAYDRWMDDASSRREQREAAIASMTRAQGRAAADELRKTLEQTERETTEGLKAQDAEERARNKAFIATTKDGDRFRAELAALSPAERKSTAMAMGYGPLVPADTPGANRFLKPDPEFWRRRRSSTEVHTITLSFYPYQTCGQPAVRDALSKAWTSLDWMAFKRIVERPW